MKGSVFNKMVEGYISHLTAGSAFYSNLIRDCLVPDQLEKVPIANQKQFEKYVQVFDNMKIYDRIYLDSAQSINLEQEIISNIDDEKNMAIHDLEIHVGKIKEQSELIISLLEDIKKVRSKYGN